jgi:hypothetical protein
MQIFIIGIILLKSMKKASIFFTGLILLCSLIYAQETTETITRDFFVSFKNDPGVAYVTLFNGIKWIDRTTVETNKTEFTQFLTDIGAYCGNELIATKKIGESYQLKSFLVKYERQPIRFTFLLYKPQDKWVIQNFSWDSDLENELYQSSSFAK